MAQMTAGPVNDPAWQWTVDGVSPEAQAAARQAAEREGLPLGTWIQAAIMRAAEGPDDVSENPRPARRYF